MLRIFIIFFFIGLTFVCGKLIYVNIKNIKKNDVLHGKVIGYKVSTPSTSGGTVYQCEILGNDNNIYITEDASRNPKLEIQDKVYFRQTHFINNARVLSINGKKVNSYYGFMDFFSLLYIIVFIGVIIHKLKLRYERRI